MAMRLSRQRWALRLAALLNTRTELWTGMQSEYDL